MGVHPAVAEFLFREQWESAHMAAAEMSSEIAKFGHQPDGLLIRAGDSWHRRFEENHVSEE